LDEADEEPFQAADERGSTPISHLTLTALNTPSVNHAFELLPRQHVHPTGFSKRQVELASVVTASRTRIVDVN
jgi:hypothetical protein